MHIGKIEGYTYGCVKETTKYGYDHIGYFLTDPNRYVVNDVLCTFNHIHSLSKRLSEKDFHIYNSTSKCSRGQKSGCCISLDKREISLNGGDSFMIYDEKKDFTLRGKKSSLAMMLVKQ